MTTSPIRVRFAPSPTGHLHIGGARTALYNWLFARHHGGTFLLRIEDTDRERHQEEAVPAILESMKWLELEWDEGPIHQSERFDIYRAEATRLRESGQAYPCFCSRERLETLRARQKENKENIGYDGHCSTISKEDAAKRMQHEDHTLRLRIGQGMITVQDLVHGMMQFDASLLDDFILLKTDQTPTYNFAVAVDDAQMKISHVIRGDDHLSNTPKQLRVIEALGCTPPRYAHIPMILGSDKVKLSKRHGAVSVMEYQALGFLPEALVNYLALLGWSLDGERERFTLQELVEHFSLERVSKTASVFDMEKATWMNAELLKELEPAEKAKLAIPFLRASGAPDNLTPDTAEQIITAVGERLKRLSDLEEQTAFMFKPITEWEEKAARHLRKPEGQALLITLRNTLSDLPWGNPLAMEVPMRELAEKNGASFNQLVHPVRAAMTGRAVSFGIFDVLDLLGQDKVRERIDNALRHFQEEEN